MNNKQKFQKNKRGAKRPTTNKVGAKEAKDRVNDRADSLKPMNDFAWYNRNPQLTIAAASLPFPYRPGMEVQTTTASAKEFQIGTLKKEIPGVIALEWVPAVGQSSTATDPASIAAKEIFAKVRSVFSGSIEADPPDFIIYLMALDSIFSAIGAMKRIYRIMNAFTPQNYQIPDTLLNALGLGVSAIQQWRQNKAQAWQYINELVGMTRKFRCPAVFDVFNRHYWMNDNVYADDATANSQMFVFVQQRFYQFQVTGDPVAVGNLTGVTIDFTSPVNAYNAIRGLINALANGDDAYIISGYLTRAFDSTPNFVVDEIESNPVFSPVYAPEVLMQIENIASIDTPAANIVNLAISQDPATNAILSSPAFGVATALELQPMLSIRSDAPGVIDVVEATRLAAYADFENVSSGNAPIICATEIPCRLMAYTIAQTGGVFIPQSHTLTYDNSSSTYPKATADVILSALTSLSSFDWSPRMVISTWANGSSQPIAVTSQAVVWDMHNVTTMTAETMRNIHRICLLSEFNSFGDY